MLPDYIIYDELKRDREKRERHDERPRLEIPKYIPPHSDSEFDGPEKEEDSDSDRGVTIIQL